MAARALSQRQAYWLLAAALAGFASTSPHLPLWLSLTVAVVLLWHGAVLRRLAQSPPPWLLSLLGLGGALAITLYYQTLFGRNPGVALLILLFALKLLEMRGLRDGYAVVLLNFFLILTQYFYTQSIASAGMTLVAVTLSCMALLMLNHETAPRVEAAKLCGLMLAQATPFMLLFFVLFPRLSSPLWGLPLDAQSGVTGLSETMSPGSISQLTQSDAIAFRVHFLSPRPPQRALYWRGPVLAAYDGVTWTAVSGMAQKTLPYTPRGAAVDYSVTLEAHGKPWLFALELPAVVPGDSYLTMDYQLLARSPVRARLGYEMRSYPDTVAGNGDAPARLREALQLPPGGNPRARSLAQEWRAQLGADASALIRRMLDYYRAQRFIYTLAPTPLGEQAMDDFLFETRQGFCEHFAASFVFMMRTAGIPARVVTGYQGGELNPVDDTVIVRQSDAHAWAEVWIDGVGWQRVDPTAAIAPGRIDSNLAAALPSGEGLPLLARPGLLWLHDMRFRWDALANAWNQRVLGYNPARQRELLLRLGMQAPDWTNMTIALSLLCGAVLLALGAWAVLGRSRLDPAQAAWRRLSRKLAASGLARRSWEGPQAYAARVGASAPSLGGEVAAIADIYAGLRYGRLARPAALKELRQRVRGLRP